MVEVMRLRSRRREYATDLSDTEEQTLAQLRARIPSGAVPGEALSAVAPATPRGWRSMGYLSTAAVVVLLTMGSAILATRSEHDPAPVSPAATVRQVNPAYSVDQLLAALDRSATPAASNGQPHRRSLSVVVARRPEGCRVSTVTVDASIVSTPARRPLAGQLTVASADPPSSAAAQAGCSTAAADPPQGNGRTVYDGRSDNLGGAWLQLADRDDRLARSAAPLAAAAALQQTGGSLGAAAADADAFGPSVAKMCAALAVDCVAFTWTVVVELLSDPARSPEYRAAAVRRAAAAGQVTAVAGTQSDLAGRVGGTLRVPYLPPVGTGFAGAQPTTAELTFDPRTGSLLQLTWRDAAGDRTEAIILNP